MMYYIASGVGGFESVVPYQTFFFIWFARSLTSVIDAAMRARVVL